VRGAGAANRMFCAPLALQRRAFTARNVGYNITHR
jgi:hypothetical protein